MRQSDTETTCTVTHRRDEIFFYYFVSFVVLAVVFVAFNYVNLHFLANLLVFTARETRKSPELILRVPFKSRLFVFLSVLHCGHRMY